MNKKTAVVTGASSGIGKVIYEGLKDEGFHVIGVSRRGPNFHMNLSKPLNMDFPFTGVTTLIDLLVNCAGALHLDEHRVERYIMDVNFWGTWEVIQNLLPQFSAGACVINIASISGMRADDETPIYAAAKAALISLTKSFAKQYAGIYRFNCISPGFYKTNLVPGETPQELIDTIPMGREEEPEKLFPVVKMIYETEYMTGSNIVVDGGLLL